jgi:acetamidase/formamidase
MQTFHLDDTQPHAFWDKSHPARLTIKSGDSVVFEVLEASSNQIGPQATTETLKTLSFDPIAPLTGPVTVEGAQPGDALEVEVLSIEHKGWGWSAVLPDFGLLAQDFTAPYLHLSRIEGSWCWFTPHIRIPYEPFCGTMGVAPAESGRFNTLPPRRNGGNLDIRHLTPGARVWLPVLVPGAIFSCGDCHAAQGDGEVNGTAIEMPCRVTLQFNLHKAANLPELRFVTPAGKKLTTMDEGGYYVTTAAGPDLFQNAQQAIRYMIDHLVSEHRLTREQAYCLCGIVVDLKISQIVDAPNWMVSAYLPLSIFV